MPRNTWLLCNNYMLRIKNAFVHFILLFLRNTGTCYYVISFNKWLKLKVTCCRFCPTFSQKMFYFFQCLGRDPVNIKQGHDTKRKPNKYVNMSHFYLLSTEY